MTDQQSVLKDFIETWKTFTSEDSRLAGENLTITWNRCKITGKLILITNRKSYMSFQLVLKLVILNDLERRNGRYIALFQRIW